MSAEVIIRQPSDRPLQFEVRLASLHGDALAGFESREKLLATRAHRLPRNSAYTWPLEFADAELERRRFKRSGPWRVIGGDHHAEVKDVRVV